MGTLTMSPTRAATYTHTQLTPSTVWSINHNLNGYPIIDVLFNDNGVLTKIIPSSVVLVDDNNVTITFTQNYTGIARLAG